MKNKDIEEIILLEMSRANTDFVRDIVLNNEGYFDKLFQIVIKNEEPVSRRAIWSLDYCTEQSPELLTETQKQLLVDNIFNFSHEGLVRHSLRILARYDLSESYAGKLVSICFDLLLNPKTSIASKAWCIDILFEFSLQEEAIIPELIVAIEFQQETASAGIKNKSRRMLKKLYSKINT